MAFADDYVDVATRLVQFRERHPEGSLQPVNPDEPVKVITIGDKVFLQYVAAAYRNGEDARPGIGIAWEPFPGRTPYTKDSEAMVVETSAWGRAIVAALAADTKKGVASADEVRSAQERRSPAPRPEKPKVPTLPELVAEAKKAATQDELSQIARTAAATLTAGELDNLREVVTKRRVELKGAAA